jgi:RHS repeat-associated protein
MRRCLTTLSLLVLLLALTAPAFAQTVLFGPMQYTRTAGPPNQFTDTFTLPSGTTPPYTLHVVNGNANGTNRISSATVTLNGAQILGPSDFGQNVAVIDRTIALQANNTLEIRLTSAPGSFITISALDTSAGSQPTALTPNPLNLSVGATGTLTATLTPAPTAAGTLAVSSANTAVATIPTSVSFAAGQTSVPFTVTAVASGSTTVTVTFNGGSAASQVTVTPPPPTITSFTPTSGTVGTTVTITGTNFVNIQTVAFNGVAAVFTINNVTTITAVVPSGATTGPIAVTTPASMATSATNFTALVPPTITRFMPTSGPVGTTVTITGQNFDPVAANNQVKFNGKPAIITSATGTSIITTVPQGATTGPITVTTSLNTATGPQPFTVELSQNFTLSAAPALTAVLQGGQGSYALSVTAVGSFTGLVPLGVTGVPAGVTATFSSPALTAGQTAYLTVTAGTAVPAGPVTFNLTGTTQLETGTSTQTIPLTLNVVASGGQTAVQGQFLNAATGAPIPGVQITLAGIQALTDAAGTFLLQNVPSGTQQLMIDANVAVAGFPIYSMDVTLTAGQTHVLPSFFLTPPPPAEAFVAINNATTDQVVSDARFPGVEFRLLAGVTITGWDGFVKNRVAIQRYTLDRLGVPPPPGPTRSLYQLSFGTPMGGFLSPPGSVIPVMLPNDLDLDPGEQAELWYYDASPLGGPGTWRLAGMGTVSEDGTRIVSDPGVGIQRFCGFCGVTCFINRQSKQPNRNPNSPKGADPVDLTFGQMIVGKTDLVLPGRFPLTIARTYNPFDAFGTIAGFQPALGPGWSLSADPILLSSPAFLVGFPIRLVLPGNARIDFVRQANGTYVNSTHPAFKGAVVTVLDAGFATAEHLLRFKDGTTWRFKTATVLGQRNNEYLTEMADRNGNRVTIERDGAGRILRIVDAIGRVLQVTYTGARITQIRDPLGRTVQYSYDTNGRLSIVTDPQGGVTIYTYDAEGRILTITDVRGIQYIQNFYGPSGRVLRQVLADGAEWRFRYKVTGATVTGPSCTINPQIIVFPPPPACPPNSEDSWENFQAGYSFQGGTVTQTTLVDQRGDVTPYSFNGAGFETERINALGQKVKFARDASGQILTSTDELGRNTTFTYDATGNVLSITDPNSQVTRFEYEPTFNRVTKITDALNQVTEFTYDAKGNLLTTKDPLNQVTTIAYNAFGQPLTVTDALNQVMTFAYDAVGNLVITNDPLGNQTQRVYDTVSRLIALTDPRGSTTDFGYDSLNRPTQINDALNALTAFSYDPNGNLLSVTDTKNQTTTYTYDVMDRLATRTDALNRTETYGYDLNGNLNVFTARKNQASSFGYDALNRRVGASYGDGSSTTFTYDAVGRLAQATDSGAGAIQFSYDILDRLSQAITPQGAIAYQYDTLGRRTSLMVGGLPPVTYQYDAASRLTQVAQGSLAVTIGYDAAGRRISLTYPNGATTTYSYDAASRLTNTTHQGSSGVIESVTYTYDAAGNRLTANRSSSAATQLPTAATASYDAANEQVQFNTAALTYDANGNMTSDGSNTHTWDARNRLVAQSGPGLSASFQYDALGRRISKTVNGQTTQFLYDGNDIIAEIQSGAITAFYLRGLNIDEPFIRITATGNEYYHTDALGSVLALTNDAGAVTTTYVYEAFGKTTITGTSSNPFQFTGRENDNSGLYYYRARYYNSLAHRFIQEDPFIGIPRNSQTSNLYSYVLNDPISYRDPSGLIAQVPPLIVAGAIFGGVGAATGAIAQGVPVFSAQFAALTTFGIANGLIAGAFASAGVPIPPAAIGAVTSGISNLISQTIAGRKPINVGSVAGAAVGGAAGAVLKAAAQAGLAGATTVTGQALPTAVTNALGSGLGLASQVSLPIIGAAIGGGIGGP